jgi:hypothetical protein
VKTQRWPENTPRFHVFHDVPSRFSPVGVTNLAYIENCGEIQVRKRNFVRPLLISNKCIVSPRQARDKQSMGKAALNKRVDAFS